MLKLGVWSLWSLFGIELFEELVDRVFATGRRLYELTAEAPDFEPCHEPECNILCFRHLPRELQGASPEATSDFQQQLRRRITAAGDFYITGTRLDGAMVLRTTVMNPGTDESHLAGLLESLRKHGAAILRGE